MALFSFRHSTKTFSPKVTRDSRRAKHGQTAAHLRYITRPSVARIVIEGRLPNTPLPQLAKQAENDAAQRKGRVCERFIVALPVEATQGQREALIRAFCEHMTKQQAAYIAALHDQTGNDIKNPHAHIVLFDKHIKTGGRGRPRSIIGMARKSAVENAARDWALQHNRLMTTWGYPPSSMIDHRSFLERNIDKIPTIHEGSGSRAALSAKHPIRPKTEWQHVDQGHSRAEANKIIKDINTYKETQNAQERTNRLASSNGSNRTGSNSSIKKHRAHNQRGRATLKHAEPPFIRIQGNQTRTTTNLSSSSETGEQSGYRHRTGSVAPFSQLANSRNRFRS